MKHGKRVKGEENEIKPGKRTKEKKIIPKKQSIIIIALILITTIIISFVIYKVTYTEEYANKKMTKVVTKYYETEIKENGAVVNRLIVTLQTLKDAGYNIRGIAGRPGVSKDLTKAFSYIIIENPDETDKEKIIYTIENHLDGIIE